MPSLALGGADYPVELVVTPRQVTILTDPAMYTEPVRVREYYKRAPAGSRMLEYECTEGMWIEHEENRSARPGAAEPAH